MKAIAFLTICFLPGAFVAAFLAMPLFNWDADVQASVMKNRFWVYWAVAFPATLLVLGSYRVWWVTQEWEQRKEDGGGLKEAFGAFFGMWSQSSLAETIEDTTGESTKQSTHHRTAQGDQFLEEMPYFISPVHRHGASERHDPGLEMQMPS